MNLHDIKGIAESALDMRDNTSLSILIDEISGIEDDTEKAIATHEFRAGSIANALDFVGNVAKKKFPWMPRFVINMVMNKVETYINQKLAAFADQQSR